MAWSKMTSDHEKAFHSRSTSHILRPGAPKDGQPGELNLDKPLYTLLFLLQYQVKKFIKFFRSLRAELQFEIQIEAIDQQISKFEKHYKSNFLKLKAAEQVHLNSGRPKFTSCLQELSQYLGVVEEGLSQCVATSYQDPPDIDLNPYQELQIDQAQLGAKSADYRKSATNLRKVKVNDSLMFAAHNLTSYADGPLVIPRRTQTQEGQTRIRSDNALLVDVNDPPIAQQGPHDAFPSSSLHQLSQRHHPHV